jgi:hypothetical protein
MPWTSIPTGRLGATMELLVDVGDGAGSTTNGAVGEGDEVGVEAGLPASGPQASDARTQSASKAM